MTLPLESDPAPWMRLCDAVEASGRSAADLAGRVAAESGDEDEAPRRRSA